MWTVGLLAAAHESAIAAGATIRSVSATDEADKSTWVVDGDDLAVQTVMAFDVAAFLQRYMAAAVQAERERRLALGFSYDFGDERGVHHIGTTPDDMVGWRDVIDYANALVDLGDTTTQIAIVTDTGPALVTAPEWQAVMLQAAQVRQVLWARSFELQAMNPIPANYADDSHWT